jgi:hypothetical protein
MDTYAVFVIDQLVKEYRAAYGGHPRPDVRQTPRTGRFTAIRSSVHGLADRVGHASHHVTLTDATASH